MRHVPSLCVLCSPCYSKWCYGQILAIAPLQKCMGENSRKTLSTARGRGGVSTWYFHQMVVGMWAKLWGVSHLFVCFVALVIPKWCYGQILAIAPLQKCMGENRRKTLSTARGRGGVSTWYFHQMQVGMWAKLWDMSHLFVCFVALVIQGGAMAKFWPLHHYKNVWERIVEKHLAQLVGEGACQPDIFTKWWLGCELSYGTCPISLCAL